MLGEMDDQHNFCDSITKTDDYLNSDDYLNQNNNNNTESFSLFHNTTYLNDPCDDYSFSANIKIY
jgi:hypothetical protein